MSFTPRRCSGLLRSNLSAIGRQGQEGTRERSQVSGYLKRRGANWEKARRRESPGSANRPRRSPHQLADSLGTSALGRRLQQRLRDKPSGREIQAGNVVNEPPPLSALGGGCLQTERPLGADRSPKGRTFLGVGTDCPYAIWRLPASRQALSLPSRASVDVASRWPVPNATVKRIPAPIRNSAASKCSAETPILLSPLFSDRGPQ